MRKKEKRWRGGGRGGRGGRGREEGKRKGG